MASSGLEGRQSEPRPLWSDQDVLCETDAAGKARSDFGCFVTFGWSYAKVNVLRAGAVPGGYKF